MSLIENWPTPVDEFKRDISTVRVRSKPPKFVDHPVSCGPTPCKAIDFSKVAIRPKRYPSRKLPIAAIRKVMENTLPPSCVRLERQSEQRAITISSYISAQLCTAIEIPLRIDSNRCPGFETVPTPYEIMKDCFDPGAICLIAEFEDDSSTSAATPPRSSKDVAILVQNRPKKGQSSVTHERSKVVQHSLTPDGIAREFERRALIVFAATRRGPVQVPFFVERERTRRTEALCYAGEVVQHTFNPSSI